MTILQKITEAILTHPEDEITMDDIMNQMPDGTNRQTVSVYVSRDLKNSGFVAKNRNEGQTAIYKILTRDPKHPIKAYDKKYRKVPKKQKGDVEVSAIVTGKAIVRYIHKLEEKVKDVSSSYSDLQSELSKEKAAALVNKKENLKKIEVLKKEVETLRAAVKRYEDAGSGFTMREMIG